MTADPDPASGPAAGSASGQAPGAAPCFAFVGPSGAGKDSVMAAVARARPDVLLEEVFGPVTLLVRYTDGADLHAALAAVRNALDGNGDLITASRWLVDGTRP